MPSYSNIILQFIDLLSISISKFPKMFNIFWIAVQSFEFPILLFLYNQNASIKMRELNLKLNRVRVRLVCGKAESTYKRQQISVDTLEEQLSIYKTTGKNCRSKLMKPWALFIVISSSINPSSASSLDVSFTAHPFILLQTTCTALANWKQFLVKPKTCCLNIMSFRFWKVL